MNKSLIKQIILERREEIDSVFSKERIIEREIELQPHWPIQTPSSLPAREGRENPFSHCSQPPKRPMSI